MLIVAYKVVELARPGWAGHKDRPVRLGVRRLVPVHVRQAGSQGLKARGRRAVCLSMTRITIFSPWTVGSVADAQVDRPALDAHADASVLGDAAFGNIDVRHDFQPADYSALDIPRVAHYLVEYAVDTVPDAEVFAGWLDMDV